MHIDMTLDLQFGSTGKGLLAGYLAKRNEYDAVVCAFAANAGHTYIDKSRNLNVMTQQLPTAITSPTVKNVLLGPGALISLETLENELEKYSKFMKGKRLMIHPSAAIITSKHVEDEHNLGLTKIGSTTKGVGAAMIDRIIRNPDDNNVAASVLKNLPFEKHLVTREEFDECLGQTKRLLVEGAQGFSLSMYHGFYPYTTSRDVTPWQLAADCSLPFSSAGRINVYGTLRTFPIRVNNRDGTSGPGYSDQSEIQWNDLNLPPELTTVTKLPRRIFSFSQKQLNQALRHCCGFRTILFLNFANYFKNKEDLNALVSEVVRTANNHGAGLGYLGFGPDDADVRRF